MRWREVKDGGSDCSGGHQPSPLRVRGGYALFLHLPRAVGAPPSPTLSYSSFTSLHSSMARKIHVSAKEQGPKSHESSSSSINCSRTRPVCPAQSGTTLSPHHALAHRRAGERRWRGRISRKANTSHQCSTSNNTALLCVVGASSVFYIPHKPGGYFKMDAIHASAPERGKGHSCKLWHRLTYG